MTNEVGFGLLVPTLMAFEPIDLDGLRQAGSLGDANDIDVLWVGDHLLYPAPILDATVSVTVLGTCTRRVRVGTNVLQLPLRRAIDVAKSYATISDLTGGRVILGVGVGGEFEPEWTAAGVERTERGARCDEAIDALSWYWSGRPGQGRYFRNGDLAVDPPPVGGRIPIWVGGRAGAAVRRAARCDGTLNMWVSPARCAKIRQEIAELRGNTDEFTFGLELLAHVDDDPARARRHVRDSISRLNMDPHGIEKYAAFGSHQAVAERVLEFLDAGIEHVSFYLPGHGWFDQARRITEQVIPLIRAARSGRTGASDAVATAGVPLF